MPLIEYINKTFCARIPSVSLIVTLLFAGKVTERIIFYQLTIVPHGDCVSRYGIRYGKRLVTDRMLCAVSSSEESCRPDSGGLLVVRSPGSFYSLAGILSIGLICDSGGSLGVFTNITALNDWLVETIHW